MSWMIKLENVSKMYRLGLVSSDTLQDDFKRAWYKFRGKEDPFLKIGEENKRDSAGGKYVWALKDINFEVNKGVVLGIIGKNGAGKSTLLKLLSKVTKPTTGSISTRGRIASLLEVGTGFHPELTGRENIFLNGAILGMKKNEIKAKFDEIVDFSGCERYIETPVKRYSSGMHVRLAFAVAAHLDPEILVVDEVLAVGDAEFQSKAIGKMKNISEGEGRTVLFVSHNMASIKTLCDKAILLENGSISMRGNVNDIVNSYINSNLSIHNSPEISKNYIKRIQEGIINKNNPTFEIEKIQMLNNKKKPSSSFYSNENICVNIEIKTLRTIPELRIAIQINDEENNNLLTSISNDDESFIEFLSNERISVGNYNIKCNIPSNIFSQKKYYLSLEIINVKIEHLILKKFMSFEVNFLGYNNLTNGNFSNAFFRPKYNWDIKKNKC